jgi:hypothetical protein
VLDRLARALALSDVERDHLYLLALGHPPQVRRTAAGEVTRQLQRVLDAISDPALIATSTWDIVAWNAATTAVFGDFGAIPARQRNTLRLMFAPGRRERTTDWEHHARGLLALFRAETVRSGATDRAALLVDELSRSSPEFAALWGEQDLAARGPGVKRVASDVGFLTLDYASFAVHGHADLQMLVYTPSTPSDATRLRTLIEHRARG